MGPRRQIGVLPGIAALAVAGWSGGGRAQDIHAAYSATWAGLPAAGVRLILHDGATRYDDRIAITTRGLPWLFTRFRGSATAEGRIGTRRFDVVGRILSRSRGNPGTLRLDLILRPIAGFKNRPGAEDPENAPRTVELLVTDDGRTLPLWLRVPIWYLPLVVRLDHLDGIAQR